MTEKNKNIYYTVADIEKYLNGDLSAPEMHALEKASQEDPFLGDALEGMKKDRLDRGTLLFDEDIPELKRSLEARIGRTANTPNLSSTRYRLRIAASIALLIALGALSYHAFVGNKYHQEFLASHKEIGEEKKMNSEDTVVQRTEKQTATGQTGEKSDTVIALNAPSHIQNAPRAIGRKQGEHLTSTATTHDISMIKDKKTITNNLTKPLPSLKTDTLAFASSSSMFTPLLKSNAFKNNAPDNNTLKKIEFTGRVIGTDGKPVASASVFLKNRTAGTVTDSTGSFRLYLATRDSIANITVSSIGYQPLTTVLVRNNADLYSDSTRHNPTNNTTGNDAYNSLAYNNEIHLQPANNALNDVVVTGLVALGSNRPLKIESPSIDTPEAEKVVGINRQLQGRVPGLAISRTQTAGKQKALVQKTAPSTGWEAYNDYLDKNKKIGTADSLLAGNEVISFVVGKNGILSSFRIEKSLSATHDAEAIRLVKQGPAWRSLTGKKERTTLIVPF